MPVGQQRGSGLHVGPHKRLDRNWSADMPFEWVAMRCAAQNHTVSGNLDRCITAPAVIDV